MDTNFFVKENTKLNLEEIRAAKTNLQSKPIQFNIDLTGRCNINPPCVFCSLKGDGYQYNAIDISAVDKYLPFLSRCERVGDCSFGEPLTHPDFLKLVQKVAENGQTFTFATNGLLLTQKRAEILAAAGEYIGFSISLNAATSATYYKLTGQNFDRVIANVRYFINVYRDKWGHNPPLAMSFIVMRVNCEEVTDFLKLAQYLEIKNINLRHLFNIPDGSRPRNDFGYKFIYSDEMLTQKEYDSIRKCSKILARELGLNLIIQWEPSDSEIKNLSVPGVNMPCLFPWKFLFVQEHSKDVYMCCYSNALLGSLNKNSLEQIWNGNIVIEARKSLISGQIPELCKIHGLSCPLVLKGKDKASTETIIAINELTSDIVMGENDSEQCTEGWHELENFPPKVRWTTEKADALLKVSQQHNLMLEALTYYPTITNNPIHGHIEIDGAAIGDFSVFNSGWNILKFTLPEQSNDKVIKVTIVIHEPWIPAEIMTSSDQRVLGIAVQRMWAE
jgi:MoaA/NifB/PqqE/SkfB family radical SAM enzyme